MLKMLMYWVEALREECRLGVFENRVLRRIFGRQRNEVTGEWRRLRNKENYVLYSSLDIIRVMKSRRLSLAGYLARMGRGEVHTGFWLGNLKEGGHLEDLRLRWEDNIKMDLQDV
jgi:hypothetical protein